MVQPKKPIGTCPACDTENVPLGKCKYLPEGTRVCAKCADAAHKAAYAERKKEKTTKSVKKPAIKEHQPVDDGRTHFTREPAQPVPTAVETGHANGRAVGLLVMCYEVSDLRRVLQLTEFMDVSIHPVVA